MSEEMTSNNKKDLVQLSKKRVLLFFGFCLLLTCISLSIGYLKKDQIKAMAGPLAIEIRNESDSRIVADLFVEEKSAGLEMEPGEGGVIRFPLKKSDSILIRFYGGNRAGPILKTIEEGPFPKDTPSGIKLTLLSTSEVKIEHRHE